MLFFGKTIYILGQYSLFWQDLFWFDYLHCLNFTVVELEWQVMQNIFAFEWNEAQGSLWFKENSDNAFWIVLSCRIVLCTFVDFLHFNHFSFSEIKRMNDKMLLILSLIMFITTVKSLSGLGPTRRTTTKSNVSLLLQIQISTFPI